MKKDTRSIHSFWILFPLIFILFGALVGTSKFGIPIEFLLIIGTAICCIIASYMSSIVITFGYILLYPRFKFSVPLISKFQNLSIIDIIMMGSGTNSNIQLVDSCSTRVRISVHDVNNINIEKFAELEKEDFAYDIVGNQIQIITESKTSAMKKLLEKAL